MSLMPSSRITVCAPVGVSMSRARRANAFGPPIPVLLSSTRLPLMPLLSTLSRVGPGSATSRSDRASGHRRLALTVDLSPSVIESPNATTAPRTAGARTSTAVT
jgi:hypothetical protein